MTAIVIALAVALTGLLQPARAVPPTGDATPTAETAPVSAGNTAANDVAIWVNPADPSRSVVIGTDTTAGLEGYNLSGSRLWKLAASPAPHSVDMRRGFSLSGQPVDVVATLGDSVMRFYTMDPTTRKLTDQSAQPNGVIVHSADKEFQGICMYKSSLTSTTYAFTVSGEGVIQQWELFEPATTPGKIDARSVRGPFDSGLLGTPVEACVADDQARALYVSERDTALWRYGAEPADSTMGATGVDFISPLGRFAADVKGLALVNTSDTTGYLIASSAGASTFMVYRREANNAFVRQFKVIDGAVDGCSKSKGIDAVVANLGPSFPDGVFVCQDGTNTAPAGNQNYKLVPLAAVADMTAPLPAVTTTTTAPGASTTTTTAPTGGPGPGSSTTPVKTRSGYWMVGNDGKVYAFGDSKFMGHAPVPAGFEAVDLEPTPSGNGYWIVDSAGRVFSMGDANFMGNADAAKLDAGEKVTSLSSSKTGNGYWMFTTRGRVLTFGDATHYGDMAAKRLNGPVLDSIPTASGKGYYMVASDGGIFSFGDAKFLGSMGGKRLNAPVQSLVPDGDGVGYWLVASDGGIFAFEAPFKGSMGDKRLNKPVTGMVRFGNGYLMVAEDGGIFNFSDKQFHGSLGSSPPARPVVAVAALG
jgi:myo-inositol-hexaphosphate 3-phosphohydrolase